MNQEQPQAEEAAEEGEGAGSEPAASEAAQVDAPGSSIPPPSSDVISSMTKSGGTGRPSLDALGAVAIAVFVLVGGLLVFLFSQTLVPAAEAQLGAACRPLAPEPKSGPVPSLELEDLDGAPVSLEDFRGKFLVLNFWATWCEPCTREWPDLDMLARRLGERDDVVVIAVSVDQEPDAIGPYLERMGLTDTPVQLLRAKVADAHQLLGSEKIPDTYFVSPEGEMEAVFVNVREWGRAKAVRCVEASAG